MEANTVACSLYIAVPATEIADYLRRGYNLGEFALDTAVVEQIDEAPWRGAAGVYHDGLCLQSRHQDLVDLQVVEWFTGREYGQWSHTYLILLIPPRYFGGEESGTHCHWISFVDPERSSAIIAERMPTVRRAELHSVKARLEHRIGHCEPVPSALTLDSHTIYVDAPADTVVSYLADTSNLAEWNFPVRHDGLDARDEYGRPIKVRTAVRDLRGYHMIEHDTHFVETGDVVRAPFLVVPASFAFGQPEARGVVLHRVTATKIRPNHQFGMRAGELYDAELVRAKRVLGAKAGNSGSFVLGSSYRPIA